MTSGKSPSHRRDPILWTCLTFGSMIVFSDGFDRLSRSSRIMPPSPSMLSPAFVSRAAGPAFGGHAKVRKRFNAGNGSLRIMTRRPPYDCVQRKLGAFSYIDSPCAASDIHWLLYWTRVTVAPAWQMVVDPKKTFPSCCSFLGSSLPVQLLRLCL